MAQINIPLGIDSLEIIAQTTDNNGHIIIDVVSKKTHSICHKCGKPATKSNGTAPIRLIRHLPILDTPVYLRITPLRYSCEFCDDHPTTTEQYDWCKRNAKTTNGLDNYLSRCLINSTIEDVSRKENIGQRVIQSALNRLVNKKVNWDNIHNLNTIGIDEIALKKGHDSYITIISTKEKADSSPIVIAVLANRKKTTIKQFFESIPKDLKQTVKYVCSDMYDGFVNAAVEVFGARCLVVDRYHVSKAYRKPVDKLRIKEMARLKKELSAEEYAELEGMMWILRKKHECLNEDEKNSLALLYQYSPTLKKAHTYALKLTHIFNTYSKRKSAMAKINRWIKSVKKSELTIFNSFINTVSKYKPYIANYFKERKNSGFVEGLNNKIKTLKRRCYGIYDTETLFQRLFLDLQGEKFYVA
jgi:transposase